MNTCFHEVSRRRFRYSTAPIHRARASLRNSAGWNWKPAICTQLRLPYEAMPSPGTYTSSWNIVAKMRTGHAMRFQNCIGARLRTNMSGMPTTAKMPCLRTWSNGF